LKVKLKQRIRKFFLFSYFFGSPFFFVTFQATITLLMLLIGLALGQTQVQQVPTVPVASPVTGTTAATAATAVTGATGAAAPTAAPSAAPAITTAAASGLTDAASINGADITQQATTTPAVKAAQLATNANTASQSRYNRVPYPNLRHGFSILGHMGSSGQ
jgi:hypothetical protein